MTASYSGNPLVRKVGLRAVALPTGLVDNKVCAVSDIWSGLRVVGRKDHRVGPRPGATA